MHSSKQCQQSSCEQDLAYLNHKFADTTGGEEYWGTFPFDFTGHYWSSVGPVEPAENIVADLDMLSTYPQDWQRE